MSSHRSDESEGLWTTDRVQLECLATVLAAYWYSQQEFIKVELSFSSEFSVVRYDISESAAILTNEDKNFPALRARSPGSFFRAFRADLEHTFEAADKLTAAKVSPLPKRELIAPSDVERFMEELAIRTPTLSSAKLADLPNLALNRRNPYAN